MESPTQLTIGRVRENLEADGTVHDVHKQKIWETLYSNVSRLNMLSAFILPGIHQFNGNEPF
jgi:hypothetical protein